MNSKKGLSEKEWSAIKSNDSWAIFKIMAEFVEAYDKLARIGPCVSIFGSARTPEGSEYYELGVEIAKKLTQEGYGVISGGGPGIMEAANKGAQAGGGKSVGASDVCIAEREEERAMRRGKVADT